MKTINTLNPNRILSLDAFRGLTFLVMIFVNQLSGVSGIVPWMKHFHADVDGMSVPDVVFPAFLFIVGMSIPFGINSRIGKGSSFSGLQWHILYRAFGLIVMGFFMVNTEEGFNEKAMGMPIDLWALLFYAAVLFTWGVYRFESQMLNRVLRAVGIAMIVALGAIYRSGDGSGWMKPEWWGILGLIGWSYLAVCALYQLTRGRLGPLLAMTAACAGYFAVSQIPELQQHPLLAALFSQEMHATHISIVLCGLVTALIFFDSGRTDRDGRRFIEALMLMAVLAIAAYLLRPYYKISKIGATPSWALYCSAICIAIFCFLYWLIDVKKIGGWVRVVEPAASNPLITYLIPHVINASIRYFAIALPLFIVQGTSGLLFAIVFSFAVMWLVGWMNKYNLRLKL